MAAPRISAKQHGDLVALEISYEKGDATTLGYIAPDEARRLAKYLEIAANNAERDERRRK